MIIGPARTLVSTSGNEQGASAVDDELEVRYDESFESRWRKIELTAHATMLVVVVVAAVGLLGRGPVSHRIEASLDGTVNVDFEPIARQGTSTQLRLRPGGSKVVRRQWIVP